MTRFRPCIDLHDGQVKQIVGGTLQDDSAGLRTNFVSAQPSSYFADLYARDHLQGGHVIMLGPGNEDAAFAALAAYPEGLQLGGGIKPDRAQSFIDAGASHVIVTSYLFDAEYRFQEDRLKAMVDAVGRDRLVVDLSCRATAEGWRVAMNRWQTLTDFAVDGAAFERLAPFCAEFLIHAVDVEGKCQGMDEALLQKLAEWCPLPVTYAGGARSLDDLQRAQDLTGGKVDVTIGSALDIFGGRVPYVDCVAFNRRAG